MMSESTAPRTLVDRLCECKEFHALVASNSRMRQIREVFPDVGETSLKEARRRVRSGVYASDRSEPVPGESESREYRDSGNTLNYNAVVAKEINTPEALLAHVKLDTDIWEVSKWTCKAYQAIAIPRPTGSSQTGWSRSDGEPRKIQLFSISAEFRKRVIVEQVKRDVERIIASLRDYAPHYPAVHVSVPRSKLMGEFDTPDVHLGKLAWDDECGANYDVNIAEEIYRNALSDLIARSAHLNFEQIVYPVGNDWLNSDDIENRTTRGTTQSTDGRHFRTFVRAHDLASWAIEQLAQLAPVVVYPVPGNHDRQVTFYLGEVLRHRFANHPHVNVRNSPTTRKYHEFHQIMLLFTHGDKEKHSDLGTLMASEQPEMWGRTRFREAHIGHLHKVWLDEKFGVRIRMMPSLCAAEDWHTEQGYIGNVRSAQVIHWHGEEGMVAHHFHNVPAKYLTPSGR